MKAFAALVKLSLLEMLNAVAGRGSRRQAASAGAALALVAFLCLMLSFTYSASLAVGLKLFGALDLLPGMMSVLAVLMAFLLTVFAAGGMLFGGKDNDIILSLPVSDYAVLLCRVLAVYLENLFITILVLLPMALVYLFNGGPAGAAAVVLAVPVSVLGALPPTLLGVLVGFAVTWLSSRVRHSSLFASLGYLIFIMLILVGSFRMGNLFQSVGDMRQDIDAALHGPLFLFGLMGDACTGNLVALVLLALVCILPFLAVTALLCRSYRRLLSRMNARATRSKFRMVTQRGGAPVTALLKKEAARYFGSTIYLFNTSFGLVMLAVGAVAACVRRDALLALFEQEMGLAVTPADCYGVVAAAVCLMLATVSTSSVSISLEGRCLWLLKSLPLSGKTILYVKAWFNVLVGWPLTAVCILLLQWAMGFTALQGAALLFVSAGLSGAVSLAGVAINLLFPKLDAPNDTMVVKQSMAAFLGIFGGMGLAGVGILLYMALASLLTVEAYLIVCGVILAAVCLLLVRWLATAGERRFAAL